MRNTSTLHNFLLILSCLIGFSLSSCKSYYTALTIETPSPAKEELPQDIQSITLMNRSINNQFLNHNADTLQAYFFDNNYQLSVVVLDSVAADTTIRALGELMYNSGRYDVVIPVERNINKFIPYNLVPDTLNPEFVSEQCQKYNTDALMVLEQFSAKVMTDYVLAKYVDKLAGTSLYYYASLDLKYNAFFRIYKPGSKTREIELSDTIYWDSAGDIKVSMFEELPSIKQALISAGIKVALDVDKKISPAWQPEKRGYFLLDKKNDLGQQLLNENKLAEAKAYWLEKAQSTDKKIKSRAEYNLALANELEGNINQAIEWGLKSFNTQYHHQTEVYLKNLNALRESKLNNESSQ
ncbi:MAG: hypothetical protein H7X84_07240 [Verrucomicrobia bacterium]|nr:hypothetical protein [Prolixibacteraceae bacterium]